MGLPRYTRDELTELSIAELIRTINSYTHRTRITMRALSKSELVDLYLQLQDLPALEDLPKYDLVAHVGRDINGIINEYMVNPHGKRFAEYFINRILDRQIDLDLIDIKKTHRKLEYLYTKTFGRTFDEFLIKNSQMMLQTEFAIELPSFQQMIVALHRAFQYSNDDEVADNIIEYIFEILTTMGSESGHLGKNQSFEEFSEDYRLPITTE